MKLNTKILSKVLLIILISYFSYQLMSSDRPWILFDYLNLGIHEGGHLVFLPFGLFFHILAGSLTQILVPFIILIYFAIRREFTGVCFCLFWASDNIINVSVYMKDAIPMTLPLLGGDGVIHDWNWLFTSLNLLDKSELIGSIFFYIGAAGLIVSILLLVLQLAFELLEA